MERKVKIKLSAAEPDYSNIEYLPKEIIHKKIIINENGNNSIVYPDSLQKYEGNIVNGRTDTWYEYVPEQLADKEERVLLVSFHGGLMQGWGQAVYSSWVKIAEREGFVVLLPEAGNRHMWMIDYDQSLEERLTSESETGLYLNKVPASIDDNRDVKMVLQLIDRTVEKYNIDPKKVYLHGMSMGALMASMLARYFGYRFAGAAFSGALAAPSLLYKNKSEIINAGGKVPICQSHMELDQMNPGSELTIQEVIERNRQYWILVNQCEAIPKISIRNENNIAYYRGKSDYMFREVKNRDHGQTIDEAEIVWENLFDCYKTYNKGGWAQKGDSVSIAFAEGKNTVFVNGEIKKLIEDTFYWSIFSFHGMNGEKIFRGRSLMVSVEDLCNVFGGKIIEDKEQKEVWVLLPDCRVVQFAQGNIACIIENKLRAMTIEAVRIKGKLFISCEWFVRELVHYMVTECDGVIYVTDHYAQLSKNMAYLINNIL